MIKINFIDIGCSGYIPYPWDKENYGKYIDNFIGFDPLNEELNYLYKEFKNTIIYNKVVSDNEVEEKLFYICKRRRVSSLFKPNIYLLKKYIEYLNIYKKPKVYSMEKYEIEEVKKVKCIRLDTILDKTVIDYDFIKIDTEGGDFQVIKSLGKYLNKSIISIHTELYFKEMYEGITLFEEVNKFLNDNGFFIVKEMDGVKEYWNNFLYIRNDPLKKDKIDIIKKAYNI